MKSLTRDELIVRARAIFDTCIALMEAKNADYGGSDDPLANFRVSATALDEPISKGLFVRKCDKFSREATFHRRSGFKVKSESILDTMLDQINYCALTLIAIENENAEAGK